MPIIALGRILSETNNAITGFRVPGEDERLCLFPGLVVYVYYLICSQRRCGR